MIERNTIDKQSIRKKVLKLRQELSNQQVKDLSAMVASHFLSSDLYKKHSCICIYQAFRNEVTCDLIQQQAFLDNKKIFVPVTDLTKKTMEFYQIFADTTWKSGAYGILEPVLTKNQQPLQEKALILMPGLAFDDKKHRIGYGGGYYDKYLSANDGHVTASLCYHFQIIAQDLPHDIHDKKPDYIITEKGIF